MRFHIQTMVCVLGVLLALSACTASPPEVPVHETIIHAAGTLWGEDREGVYRAFYGSNSLEGLENCAAHGQTAVELDFNFTSDGVLACIHDWSPEYIETIEPGVPLSEEAFRASEIYWNYTPLTLADAADFLRTHEDMCIVTDIKERFDEAVQAIAAACPDLADRFIVQIYEKDQYETVRQAGFDRVIFTLYRLSWAEKTDWRDLRRFAASHPLEGYTFHTDLCEVPGYVEGMLQTGVPLYVHTVQDAEEAAYYRNRGISGVYADDIPGAYTPEHP